MIGHSEDFADVRINGDTVEDRFGTVPRSMYSLFEIMTLEGWQDVARPLVTKQPMLFFFIAIFIMVFTFGMLNMIIGLMVSKTLDESKMIQEIDAKEAKRLVAQELLNLKTVFTEGDQDGNGSLTYEEFERALRENAEARRCLQSMGLPLSDALELYTALDSDCSGSLTVMEFLAGCAKLRAAVPSNFDALATSAGVRSLVRRQARARAEEATWRAEILVRLDAQDRC